MTKSDLQSGVFWKTRSSKWSFKTKEKEEMAKKFYKAKLEPIVNAVSDGVRTYFPVFIDLF
jgi:hypothetical protein